MSMNKNKPQAPDRTTPIGNHVITTGPVPHWRFALPAVTLMLAATILLTGSRQAQGAETVRLAIASWSATFLPYFFSKEKGYLREEGLDTKILVMRSELGVLSLISGEVEYSAAVAGSLAAILRGVPLKVVVAGRYKTGFFFISQPQLKSFQDLRGQTIGVMSLEGAVTTITKQMLRANGLDPERDVNLIAIRGATAERYGALKGKAIGATLLSTPAAFYALDEGFRRLAMADDYAPLYVSTGIVLTDKRNRENPMQVLRFIKGYLKGRIFMKERPQEATALTMKVFDIKDRRQAERLFLHEAELFTEDGMLSAPAAQQAINNAREQLGVKKEVKPGEVFDFRLTQRAWGELKNAGWKP